MPQLIHYMLDPFSRRIRLMLGELGIEAEVIEEKPWDNPDELLLLNPAGTLPIFIEDDQTVIPGVEALADYLEETRGGSADGQRGRTLLGNTPAQRAETRRLVAWFDVKFHREVSRLILTEKVERRLAPPGKGGGPTNMNAVRAALHNIRAHLDYIGTLAEHRNWLAGDDLTQADLAAAAHLSCLDYLGDVPWGVSASAKAWYQRIKSRPSFRPLLADHIRGMPPPRIYADLDF
ncbi:glutathione S-transferase family protein [Rhodoligotrophos defluvii]|uniref:glutathione S-transferase family protein n=1 Tax=Rhodoligotrophos defluvii TaxID=2561934 RepID=UPI0010C9F7EA|nr:glutathione S-transferase family protein [Rhodoligotrophos defluvii]